MKLETIYLAAGCFWGVQYYFDELEGVAETEVGYMGGSIENPTYEDVCYKETGHAETTRILYNPKVLPTEKLLRHFFAVHNPTQGMREGPNIGTQYRSAIFTTNEEQKEIANQILEQLNKTRFDGKITTSIHLAPTFWPAEEYHQKYSSRTGRGICHVNPLPEDIV